VLVVGVGGVLGEAWMWGYLGGIHSATGEDFRQARQLIGTSAGSIVAARLAGGEDPRRREERVRWDGEAERISARTRCAPRSNGPAVCLLGAFEQGIEDVQVARERADVVRLTDSLVVRHILKRPGAIAANEVHPTIMLEAGPHAPADHATGCGRARQPECCSPMLATLGARCSEGHDRTASDRSTAVVHRLPGTPPFWAREVGLWPKSQGIPWNSW
jgi:hypothetical protein